jgi:hypothetical protein
MSRDIALFHFIGDMAQSTSFPSNEIYVNTPRIEGTTIDPLKSSNTFILL